MAIRDIIFRAKRLDNGEWVEGNLFVPDRIPSRQAPTEILVGTNVVRISYQVDPDTVGQYTGRKDLNSKKVFEHDILQLYTIWPDGTKEKSARVIVQWWENDQCYVLTTKEGYHCGDFGNYGRPEYFEVIGKIHDNPELLEEGEG